MTSKKIPAIIWASVSTAPQATEDKESLPTQEAEARAVAARHGWDVIDVLRVTGHSRRYIDIHECSRDMLAEGINAFDRLLWHWQHTKNFVLIVRDASRFARTQSLHATVVETTIDKGSRIYSLSDGVIDSDNYRMWIAMGGYASAGEIDRLVKGRKRAMKQRAAIGLPTTSQVLVSHMVIRDPKTHKAVRLVVNPAHRRLWDDLAKLLLAGVGYAQLGRDLYVHFGHVNPRTGKPFHHLSLYETLMSPTFWGHSGQFMSQVRGEGAQGGEWRFEEGPRIPDGVVMNYNTHEAVYTGDLAAQVKAELQRRSLKLHNRRVSKHVYPMAGIFVCDECWYTMGHAKKRYYDWMRCVTPWRKRENVLIECTQRGGIRIDRAQEAVIAFLTHLRDEGEARVFPEGQGDISTTTLEEDIATIPARLERLILDKVTAPPHATDVYDGLIAQASEQLGIVKERLTEARNIQARQSNQTRHQAVEELQTIDLPTFWQRDARWINQFLHRILGDYQLAVRDHEVVGLKKRRPHYAVTRAKDRKNRAE